MKLTKYGHSCVKVEIDDRRLVIDPGTFSDADKALDGVDSVLVTHLHVDHLDVAALTKAAEHNRNLKIYGPSGVGAEVAKVEVLNGHFETVTPAMSFVVDGIQVRTYGGQHALIHSSVPVVDNLAYLVADTLYHPGDSYTVPNAIVTNLLVPINAPWAKVSETYDFAISLRAERTFAIHDALLSETGLQLYENHLRRVNEMYHHSRYSRLESEQPVEL